VIEIELANPAATFAEAGGEASARECGTLGCSQRALRRDCRADPAALELG